MTPFFRAASAGVRAAVAPMARAFRRNLDDPERTQEGLLHQLIERTSRTAYGRFHSLDASDGYEAFAAKMPVVCYDFLLESRLHPNNDKGGDHSVEPWIDQIVAEPVLFYELTSGSTSASKRIPYTRSLRDSFQRMFLLWLNDILENGPRLDTGRFFMSVSPSAIRGSDDLHYLRGPLASLMRRFAIQPPPLERSGGPAAAEVDGAPLGGASLVRQYRRGVARALIEGRPEVISVWNPSYLLLALDEWSGGDLGGGRPSRPIGEAALDSVKLISCWASANAASGAEALRARFPNAMLQPKGLLATEAPVTIPLFEADGFVPLLNEVFLELEDDFARIIRLHEAIAGREYSLIISQKGGLVRYRLGDRVRATHPYRQTPCLEFIGRADDVCDLVGEKLSEGLARNVVRAVGGGYGIVLPQTSDPSYVVVVDSSDVSEEILSRRAEAALMDSHRYREARLLGQLAAARVRVVPSAEARVLDYFVEKGMKIGDVKPLALVRDHTDAEALNGVLQESHEPAVQ